MSFSFARSLSLRPAAAGAVLLLAAATAASPARAMDFGDVTVSEVLVTSAIAGAGGEWLELRNNADSPIDLAGSVISTDTGSTLLITKKLVIGAGGTLVLAAHASPDDNGGLPRVDYAYAGAGFSLAGATRVTLSSNGAVVAAARMQAPITGVSQGFRCPGEATHVGDEDLQSAPPGTQPASWMTSYGKGGGTYNGADAGSPGADDPRCERPASCPSIEEIEVVGAAPAIAGGDARQLAAICRVRNCDDTQTEMSCLPAWSLGASAPAAIDAAGLFKAGAVRASAQVVVTAWDPSTGITGSAEIGLRPADSIKIAFVNPANAVHAGATVKFEAACDSGGEPVDCGRLSWSVWPSEAGTIDADGTLHAAVPRQAVVGKVQATRPQIPVFATPIVVSNFKVASQCGLTIDPDPSGGPLPAGTILHVFGLAIVDPTCSTVDFEFSVDGTTYSTGLVNDVIFGLAPGMHEICFQATPGGGCSDFECEACIPVEIAPAALTETFCGQPPNFWNPLINTGAVHFIDARGTTYDDLFGTNGRDLIIGNDFVNHIRGKGGDDCIYGQGGNDWIHGDNTGINPFLPGNDEIHGGLGNDEIWGDPGADRLFGDAGNDTLQGGSGGDFCWGGADNDTVEGGTGDDILYGEAGRDRLKGGTGWDTMWGGTGDDCMLGDTGRDNLQGEDNGDRLCGNDGNDVLNGGTSSDACRGGGGSDSLSNCDSTASAGQCTNSGCNSW